MINIDSNLTFIDREAIMNISQINPYIRTSIESKISSGNNIAFRVIYDYELIYLEKGSFTFIYDNVRYHCKTEDIIFIHPGIAHSFLIDQGDISQPHIHFDITHRPQSEIIPISFKNIDKMSYTERSWIHSDLFYSPTHSPLINITNKSEFLDDFYQIISGSCDDLTKKALMIKLIAMIVNDNFSDVIKDKEQPNAVYLIKDYIDAGNGMGMSLDDFANTFYYDKFYLERKFKKAFSINLIEYRNKKRMELANTLLNIHSVSVVSEMLGYRSIYSFSRAYKAYFGYSPKNRPNQNE